MPARAVQAHLFTELPKHETIWAIAAGCDGCVYVSVCCESTGGGTVHLYAYDVDRKKMAHKLDVAKALGEPATDGRATHGKIHFSLCPSTDGNIYAATHCSTPPIGDPHWDAHAMWNDQEKSFSGAHFFRYNPVSGEVKDSGRLFPNEGVGAMALDEGLGRCVCVTYPIGRVFFIDKDCTGLTDMGRASETYFLSFMADGHGYAFATDSYGYFMRINMKERTIEHTGVRVPRRRAAGGRYLSLADNAVGKDGLVYASIYQNNYIFRFRPVQKGPLVMEDVGVFPAVGGATGLCFGDDGFLYSSVGGCLCRMNVKTGKAENFGEIHVEGDKRHCWRCVKGKDGRLYAGDCGHKPVGMIIIDPAKL
jgi:hypothetical protein